MPRDESGGFLYSLARWCPAQRWRELGIRLRCGTWEPLAPMGLVVG